MTLWECVGTVESPPVMSAMFLPDSCSSAAHSFPTFGSGCDVLLLLYHFSLFIPIFSPHENWGRHAYRVICYWLTATAYWLSKPTKQKPTPYEQTTVHGISLCRNLTSAWFLWSPCFPWAFAELSYPPWPQIRFCFSLILLCWQLDWPNQLHCLRLPLLTGSVLGLASVSTDGY